MSPLLQLVTALPTESITNCVTCLPFLSKTGQQEARCLEGSPRFQGFGRQPQQQPRYGPSLKGIAENDHFIALFLFTRGSLLVGLGVSSMILPVASQFGQSMSQPTRKQIQTLTSLQEDQIAPAGRYEHDYKTRPCPGLCLPGALTNLTPWGLTTGLTTLATAGGDGQDIYSKINILGIDTTQTDASIEAGCFTFALNPENGQGSQETLCAEFLVANSLIVPA